MTSTRPKKVAVLMATYNGIHWLPEQTHTIVNQQDINLALYISDDESNDGTFEWLSANPHQYQYHLLNRVKSGGAAQNFFLLLKNVKLQDYDYIAFSDQDDVWASDKISHGIDTLEKNNLHAYSSNVMAFWPNHKTKLIDKAQAQKPFDFMFESAGPGCTFILSQKLALELKELLLEQASRCSQVALHDWFIYAFARHNGYSWYIDRLPKMMYRQHSHNVVGVNEGLKAATNRLSKLRSGWYAAQAILIAEILGYEASWPIQCLKKLDFKSKLKLIVNASEFRRRFRDQVGFMIFILLAKKP